MAIIWTSSHCHATLLLSGDGSIQAVGLLSGSLHSLSFCILFTYIHTYQSLSCETAINTEFSVLFSLKRFYVKYKNAILSHIGCSFRT